MQKKRKKKRTKRFSNGVLKIMEYLNVKKIPFQTEYRIAECRDKLPLPFDFVILNNNQIVCLIEYNGAQHYKVLFKKKGKKALIKQQQHDLIKEQFCQTHNIPFIVIAYWDQDKIYEILDNFFYK